MNTTQFTDILYYLLNHHKIEEELLSDGETRCTKAINYESEEISIPNFIVKVRGSISWNVIQWNGDRFTPPGSESDKKEIDFDLIQLVDENSFLPMFLSKEQKEALEVAITNLITFK